MKTDIDSETSCQMSPVNLKSSHLLTWNSTASGLK